MSDNLNEKKPDSDGRRKERELYKILRSVDGTSEKSTRGQEWENNLTTAIAKRSRSTSQPENYEMILNELEEKNNLLKEEAESVRAEPVPENPQEKAEELISQLTVAQRVTEMAQNKKSVSAETARADFKNKPVRVVSHEKPSQTEKKVTERTIVYNVPSRTPNNSSTALQQPDERKPIRKIIRVDKAGPTESKAVAVQSEVKPPVAEVYTAKPKKADNKKKKKKTFKEKFMGLFPNKKDSILEKIRKLIFLCSIIAILVCGYMVADYYIDLWKSESLHNDIAEIYETYPLPENTNNASTYEPGEDHVYKMLDSARKLLDRNPDVIGYMTIPNTPIANPIMQSADNNKYLHMDIDGRDSRAGEIFLDYRNHFDDVKNGKLSVPNSDNLVIYGHNMANEAMFGSLKYYQRDDSYYGKHPLIYINSNYECYTYKIFAYFLLDAGDSTETAYDCWNKLDFADEQDFYNFVNEAKKRSITLNDVDVEYGDKLVTLSTCNTVLGDNGRLIIMGRLLRDKENPFEGTTNSRRNPNIKWPTIYYYDKPNEKYNPDAEFIPYGSGGNSGGGE
ncbi:MAG: class B sortase [Ruminococcus sp.]|nr:class B sortase [Ruminococcus sp.]